MAETYAAEGAALAQRLRLDLIRSNRSIRAEDVGAGLRLPDVWLDKLPGWRLENSARLAKDMAHARRAARAVVISLDIPGPLEFHRLYSELVQARNGRVRYGPEYFTRLFATASGSSSVVVAQARDASGQFLGASVLAMDAKVGYYLHSAVLPAARPMGISDLLLERLIIAAQERGMEHFNFMVSPPGQAGLVRYKKKWGNRESVVLARDTAGTLLGQAAVAAIGWMARWRSRSS
ncbi:MAG: GNAT family N-acetyltransferase [Arenimonas sp.]|uniref:GNAT family N-acetyltransferase n=1 Tax=Arenimonas sp. TaxID=1872635 RepID=UPI0025BF951A|nr:GNAT family N-acetyltransferase [Arenimonas sp.]MBW8369341.1 GNAT family N-acetyltransferase [Arenimonas sp.]